MKVVVIGLLLRLIQPIVGWQSIRSAEIALLLFRWLLVLRYSRVQRPTEGILSSFIFIV